MKTFIIDLNDVSPVDLAFMKVEGKDKVIFNNINKCSLDVLLQTKNLIQACLLNGISIEINSGKIDDIYWSDDNSRMARTLLFG